MRLGLIWFSFARDCLSVVESVKAARIHYPDEPFTIVDDSLNPTPKIQLDILEGLGCKLMTSSYCRGGNLQGRVCLLGQLEVMLEVARDSRLTHLLKIDSDTVLLDSSWVEPRDLLGFGYAHYWKRTNIAGMAYVISVNAIEKILAHTLEDDERGFGGEDTVISRYAEELNLDFGKIEVSPDNLRAISYKWTIPDYDYSPCWVITVGQGRPGRRCDDIELEAYAMAKLVQSRYI